jgi:hypothetical protein
MEQTTESQPFIKRQSMIGSIFICMGFLFFYIAIKYMMIPMGFITIPRSHESWIYRIFG